MSLLLLLLPPVLSVFFRAQVTSAWMPFAARTSRSTPCALSSSSSQEEEWSIADDWNALSRENPYNSAPDTDAIFNQDIAENAAQSILADNHGEDIAPLSDEDVWLSGIIEDIITTPLSKDTPLYDTPMSSTTRSKAVKTPQQAQQDLEERMEEEIAMLVRCNESPHDFLVQMGKAVPDLTLQEKQDVAQLLQWNSTSENWQATPFLTQAIAQIFETHATPHTTTGELCMDAKAVSKWMTQSIGQELGTYTERTRGNFKGHQMTETPHKTRAFKIAPHDSRVLKMITQYSTYGTGYLTLDNLQQVYLQALTKIPHHPSAAVVQDLQDLQVRNQEHIRQVWRDLTNHGIVSPNEFQWNQERLKLQQEYGDTLGQQHQEFVDECEVLEFGAYQEPPTPQQEQEGHDAKNHKYIKKASHEQVQLANDHKTPLYLEEGQFVFIDEESCIGCMQCVNAAPSSFLMLENGRARTFQQRRGADVKQGVAACPVNCMHFVSYDELKELETVRDKGDGRDDHRHMGHKRGHTPLYVAGIDSDNNHRSSWYHHLKNKCCTSGRCPQRGCFDCPSYKQSGANPYFQQKAKQAQHVRAKHFMDNGDVDLWRKTAEL